MALPAKSVSDPYRRAVVQLIEMMGDDPSRGGLHETPARVTRAFQFFGSGYGVDPASVLKTFEDGAENYDQIVVQKNIQICSLCEHHMLPFMGVAHVGYIPDKKIVGLSKFARLIDVFARRLQVQERLTSQVADAFYEHVKPKAFGIIIECRHMCMEMRGVEQPCSQTLTSALRGIFLDDASAKAEFFQLVAMK